MQQDGVLQFLDAVEPPVRLTPRDRLEHGLTHGSDWEGVKGLHSATIASLADGDEALGIRCLLALAELCREVECSEHLGAIGGHQSILRLMTDGQLPGGARRRKSNVAAGVANNKQLGTDREPANNTVGGEIEVICDNGLLIVVDDEEEEEDEDDVQCAAALAAARIVASGCVFPMRASFPGESSALGRFPLRYDFVVASNGGGDIDPPPSCSVVDAAQSRSVGAHASQGQGTPTSGGDEHTTERISILVRPVKERQHSQFDVGFQMWPAAVILSRYLCRNPDVIRGRRVLEVGAGLGLCGLVAAHFATAVTLSDFNPVVLRALEGNVALNSMCSSSGHADGERGEGCGEPEAEGSVDDTPVGGGGVAIAEQGGVSVRHLDWDTLPVHAPGVGPLCLSTTDCQDAGQARTPPLAACNANRGDVGLADSVNSANGGEGEDMESVEHGDRFDVIIASDHICQVRHVNEGFIKRQAVYSKKVPWYTTEGTVPVKSQSR